MGYFVGCLLVMLGFSPLAIASKDHMDLQRFGYQVLDHEESDSQDSTPSTSLPPTPKLRSRKISDAPRVPLLILTESRKLSRKKSYEVLSRSLHDKDFLRDFDGLVPTYFYKKGIPLTDLLEVKYLNVKSESINKMHFNQVTPSVRLIKRGESTQVNIEGFKVEFSQGSEFMVFDSPGETLKGLMVDTLKGFFEKEDKSQYILTLRLKLFTSGLIDDAFSMIEIVVPIYV